MIDILYSKILLLTLQTRTFTKHPAEKDCSAPIFDHPMYSEGGAGDEISAILSYFRSHSKIRYTNSELSATRSVQNYNLCTMGGAGPDLEL